MKSIELLALLIKLAAIILGFGLLKAAFGIIPFLLPPYDPDASLLSYGFISLGVILIGFAFALICWNFPVSVSKWFLPESNDTNYPNINLEIESLELVFYSAIGVYILAIQVPNLAYNLLYYALRSDMGFDLQTGSTPILDILYSVLCVMIGIYLAIYSGNLKRLLEKFRNRT